MCRLGGRIQFTVGKEDRFAQLVGLESDPIGHSAAHFRADLLLQGVLETLLGFFAAGGGIGEFPAPHQLLAVAERAGETAQLGEGSIASAHKPPPGFIFTFAPGLARFLHLTGHLAGKPLLNFLILPGFREKWLGLDVARLRRKNFKHG